jgi:hypothetical protein
VDHRSRRPVRPDSPTAARASCEPEARHDDADDEKELEERDANEDQTAEHDP